MEKKEKSKNLFLEIPMLQSAVIRDLINYLWL